jgi:hypothetical protein
MSDFFAGGFPPVFLWFVGVGVLGLALWYGVSRTGWLSRRQRAQLDANTRARQRADDPQKRP